MNYIYILFITEFLLLLLALAVTRMDYISPSVVTCGIFSFSTLSIIWNIEYWNVYFIGRTYFVVTGFLLLAIITEFFVMILTCKKNAWIDRRTFINGRKIEPPALIIDSIMVISVMLMGVYVIKIWRIGGGGLASIAKVKFSDELNVGVLGKVALRLSRILPYPFIYIIVHNMKIGHCKFLSQWKFFIPIIAGSVVIFFSGGRSNYLYIFLAAIVDTIVFDRYVKGWRNIKLKKYIKPVLLSAGIFIGLFMGTRSIVKGHSQTSTPIDYLTYYLGSPLHLLNKIIRNPSVAFKGNFSMFGANTFVCFWDEMYKFGLVKEHVILNDTVFIAVGGESPQGGNVYTFLGSPLNDFGILGAYLLVIIFYGIFDWAYYSKLKYNRRISKSCSALLIYSYFFYMIFMTFYVTTTIYLKFQTLLETAIMVIIFKILTESRGHGLSISFVKPTHGKERKEWQ